ncbi:hypothetical protein [Allofranklinella schreckenbergeri]|uniref:hypothetical protein n=1 Tax=Allofranklinella schreckenbergeri TaxID=1076744 RepID=UPI0011C35B30|nr:hypothetical protein [Allofranklinella schreckenbergeri]
MNHFKFNLNPFESALLSEACYVDFEKSPSGIFNPKKVSEKLQSKEFSKSQAEDFIRRWEVVYQESNTPSGFSATLFKSKDPSATQPYGNL